MAQNNLYLFGISHQQADFDVLSRTAFSTEQQMAFSRLLLQTPLIVEVCIIFTCNRNEIYIRTDGRADIEDILKMRWLNFNPRLMEKDFKGFYLLEKEKAVEHLFRVSAGMDSLMPGETEIVGQVKAAFRRAALASFTGIYLNHLFETALQVQKRVRTQTAISVGAVSVAYAAVELAQKIIHRMSDKKAMLIGSGETGQLVALHLKQKGIRHIYVANRTLAHGQSLAEKFGGEAVSLENMIKILPDVDLVIGATASPDFMIGETDMRKVMKKRTHRPLIMIDIAIPRDFDPALGRLENIFLHDMTSLKKIVENNKTRRREEFDKAAVIVQQEIGKFLQWCRSLELKPTIISLRRKMEDIRNVEIAKYRHRVDEANWVLVEQITRGMLKKILHSPLSKLKEMDGGYVEVNRKISLVREIFDLKEEENV